MKRWKRDILEIHFDKPYTYDVYVSTYPKSILCNVLMELCAIRNNITTCDIANITDIIAMIEDICTN